MSRAGTAWFLMIAVAILAFSAYIDIVERDPTALLVGIVIVLLLFITLAVLLPHVTSPPAS